MFGIQNYTSFIAAIVVFRDLARFTGAGVVGRRNIRAGLQPPLPLFETMFVVEAEID